MKQFEGLELHAYRDSVGVLTVGYGHTGKDVEEGMEVTAFEAARLLALDAHLAESAVNHLVTVPLSQNQFDALVCFTYNVGAGALASSTLLRKVNARDFAGAPLEFIRWCHAGGKMVWGLMKRREAEAALFAGDSPAPAAK